MKLRHASLALAAAFAVSGAQAAIEFATNATQGNSSVLFVAVDVDSNVALTIDLGLQMSAFTNSDDLTANLTSPLVWDFGANSAPLGITGNDWTAAYETFKATQAGGNFQWAVFAADQITGASITATNAIPGRGLLATGNATQAEMLAAVTSSPTGNAIGNFNLFTAGTNNFGNHLSVPNGASINTSADGEAWFVTRMMNAGLGNWGGTLTWNMLMNNGETSTFQWQQQLVANPIVKQFGNPITTDSLSPAPITWSFDIATNQLILAPVPEPGTYAMLLAGLGAIGFVARRRNKA